MQVKRSRRSIPWRETGWSSVPRTMVKSDQRSSELHQARFSASASARGLRMHAVVLPIVRPFFIVLLVGTGILSSCTPTAVSVPAVAAQPATEGDCHRAESQRFVFHSD